MAPSRSLAALLCLGLGLSACPQTIRVAGDGGGAGEAGPRDAAPRPSDGGGPPPDGGGEDAACVPACGGRRCGPDPSCNQTCGTCGSDESCTAGGQCLPSCAAGTTECIDGSSFRACGLNPALGVNDFGARVPCTAGDSCGERGECAHHTCVPGELMLVIDRSSSMSFNSTWIWVRDALLAAIGARDQSTSFGLRTFPSNGCGVATVTPPVARATAAIRAGLVDPGAEADSPVEAALTGLAGLFGPPRDGQAVLLVLDGDDSCGSNAAAIEQTSQLFRGGVRTFVVGIHNAADPSFLDALAHAGGTRKARHATDLSTMTATLGAVLEELDLCDNPHAKIGAGYYNSCGLRVDGTMVCWGMDTYDESSPPPGRYTDLGTGSLHSCAITTSGALSCWGRDGRGQLQAPPGSYSQVVGGDQHGCALRLDGTVACWGYDDDGQASPPGGMFKQLTAGGFFSCGVRLDDSVECWGMRPAIPAGPVQMIDGGSFHLCAVMRDGTLDCGGRPVPPGSFVAVSAGDTHDCALAADGSITCFGANGQGQSDAPPGEFAAVAVNYEHSCAVRRSDDAFVCWGSDSNGQSSPP